MAGELDVVVDPGPADFSALEAAAPANPFYSRHFAAAMAETGNTPCILRLSDGAGALSFFLLLAGGLSYTAGAVVYALQRPDPWPATFGFHEVFHALTVVAAALHYTAIAIVVI